MTEEDTRAALDAVLAHLDRGGVPGAVASVRWRGRTLLRRGYGLASLESGLANTPATRMRIGSTSKHFVCVLLLLLRHEGRLSLDDPISRWRPELPADPGRCTLRQLMTHTGGLRDFLDLTLLSNGMAIIPDDAALDYQCRQRDSNFAPGEAFAYNNGGYRLLSLAVERELGMPLAQALRERLFEPLALFDTTLWDSDLTPLPGAAQTHLAQADGRFGKGIFPCTTLGEGGIASTLDDMQRWMAHLCRPVLWPASLLDEMTAPTPLNNGHANAYGLGLIAETLSGQRVFHHAGGMVGGNSQILVAPGLDLQIVVMSNRSDVSAPDLAQKLFAAVVGAQAAAPAPAAAGLEGSYYCAANGRHFAVERLGGVLVLRHFGTPVPLVAAEGGALRTDHAVLALALEPLRGEGDEVVALGVLEQGQGYRCERLAPVEDAASALAGFAGRWHSDELAARIAIEGDGMTVAGRYGRSRFKLQPLNSDACLMTALDLAVPLGGTLRVVAGPGEGRHLLLDTARTRGLRLDGEPERHPGGHRPPG